MLNREWNEKLTDGKILRNRNSPYNIQFFFLYILYVIILLTYILYLYIVCVGNSQIGISYMRNLYAVSVGLINLMCLRLFIYDSKVFIFIKQFSCFAYASIIATTACWKEIFDQKVINSKKLQDIF